MTKKSEFKSHRKLKIPKSAYDGLVKTLKRIEDGRIADAGGWSDPTGNSGFYMNTVVKEWKCGTVACLGGWAAIYACDLQRKKRLGIDNISKLDNKFHDWSDKYKSLSSLFHCYQYDTKTNHREFSGTPLENVKVDYAGKVLRHFLETGNVDWDRFSPQRKIAL